MWNEFMLYFRACAARMTTSESGQTLVEYALIIALVSVVLIGALQALTGNVTTVFTNIGTALQGM
jgi:pilus assembly protein Flp/PilA